MANQAVVLKQNLAFPSKGAISPNWTKLFLNATPVISNAAIDPDGAMTMDQMVENNTSNYHGFYRGATKSTLGYFTARASLKQSPSRRYGGVQIYVNQTTDRFSALVDLQTGIIVATYSSGTVLYADAHVYIEPNGCYNLEVTGWHDGGAIAPGMVVFSSDSATPSVTTALPVYQGDNASGIYSTDYQMTGANWGGEKTTTTSGPVDNGAPPNKVVTRQNLIIKSEDLSDNGVWTKPVAATITPNADMDSRGNMTLDRLVGSAGSNVYALQFFAGTLGKMFTMGCEVKLGTNSKVMIGDGQVTIAQFDLTTGLYTGYQGSIAPLITPRIEVLPNGVYLAQITFKPNALRIIIYNGYNDGSSNGTYISVGRVHVVEGFSLGEYVNTDTIPYNIGRINNQVATQQNLVKDPNDMSTGNWSSDATATLAKVAGILLPDGVTLGTVSRITGAADSSRYARNSGYYPFLDAGIRTISAWIRTVSGDTESARLTLDTTAVVGPDEVVNGTWKPLTFTALVGANGKIFEVGNGSGLGALDIYVYDVQISKTNYPLPDATQGGVYGYDVGLPNNKVAQSQNINKQSNTPGNAVWIKQNVDLIGNLIYPTTSGAGRSMYQNPTIVIPAGYFTSYFIVEASGINWINISNAQGSLNAAWFNLSNGQVGTIAVGITAKIVPLGGGIYLCSITQLLTAALPIAFAYSYLALSDADNVTTVTANGTHGVTMHGSGIVLANHVGVPIETTTTIFNNGLINNLA